MATTRQKRQKRERVSGRQRAKEHKTSSAGTSIRLPEGVSFFSVKQAGPMKLDIIPYSVPSGAGNPWKEDGKVHFERTFWAHRGIGPNNDSYICPAKTANKPCPICEARAVLAADPDSDENTVKALLPKERQLWNIYDHAEPEKGVQVWDVSFHLFGKQLDARINNADEDDDYEFFSDLEDGSTLRVGFAEDFFNKTKFFTTESIDFKSRKEPLSSDIAEAANVLDELLTIEPYEKLKAIFHQIDVPDDEDEDEDDDEPAASPKKKAPKKAKPKAKAQTADDLGIEKGESVSHEDFGTCDVVKISPDGTSLTIMDEEGEVHRAVAPDEVELIPFEDEDEPEPEPEPKKKTTKAKPKAKAKKKPEPEPEPEPDDDDDLFDDGEDWGGDDDDD